MRKVALSLVTIGLLLLLIVTWYPRYVEKPVKDGAALCLFTLTPACRRPNITARWSGGRPTTWMWSTAATCSNPIVCNATTLIHPVTIAMTMLAPMRLFPENYVTLREWRGQRHDRHLHPIFWANRAFGAVQVRVSYAVIEMPKRSKHDNY